MPGDTTMHGVLVCMRVHVCTCAMGGAVGSSGCC